MTETPEYKKPVPDPNKVDRITYREVISEWRNIAFKKIDENVSLKAENEMFKVDIKKLKDQITELKSELKELQDLKKEHFE